MDTYDEDGQRTIALSVEGAVTRDDEHHRRVVKEWEREGVDPDLVDLAYPLLEGTVAQQKAARRVLSASSDYRADTESVNKVKVLLAEAGLSDAPLDLSSDQDDSSSAAAAAEAEGDEVLAAWDQQYPDLAGRKEERYWPGGKRR